MEINGQSVLIKSVDKSVSWRLVSSCLAATALCFLFFAQGVHLLRNNR